MLVSSTSRRRALNLAVPPCPLTSPRREVPPEQAVGRSHPSTAPDADAHPKSESPLSKRAFPAAATGTSSPPPPPASPLTVCCGTPAVTPPYGGTGEDARFLVNVKEKMCPRGDQTPLTRRAVLVPLKSPPRPRNPSCTWQPRSAAFRFEMSRILSLSARHVDGDGNFVLQGEESPVLTQK